MRSGQYNAAKTSAQGISYDAGLRSYMLQVYNYMTAALIITGIVALLAASSETVKSLMYVQKASGQIGMTGIGWLVAFAPIVFVFVLNAGLSKAKASTARMMLWAFAAVMGLSLSSIFLVYTDTSIAKTFFITASVFGAMSLYGYTTKKSLASWGSFLIMGLFGIIIASLVNMFLQSPALDFAVSLIGVVIFVGLTAYDTQRIKSIYAVAEGDTETTTRLALIGALSLYMDFINLFLHLLRFFGDRRQ